MSLFILTLDLVTLGRKTLHLDLFRIFSPPNFQEKEWGDGAKFPLLIPDTAFPASMRYSFRAKTPIYQGVIAPH